MFREDAAKVLQMLYSTIVLKLFDTSLLAKPDGTGRKYGEWRGAFTEQFEFAFYPSE
jgi:hypothetical protein